jgi:hypothetical protein
MIKTTEHVARLAEISALIADENALFERRIAPLRAEQDVVTAFVIEQRLLALSKQDSFLFHSIWAAWQCKEIRTPVSLEIFGL